MNPTARALAAHGRHGDTQLVHMSDQEVRALAGLGALAGRPLTTNPHTGLPEAFKLSSLIPMIVGIGGSVLSGGTLSPWMAGLISGAATTAATGSLTQGIMGGLSGGMMSGLGAGINAMGTTAGTAAAENAAAGAAANGVASSANLAGATTVVPHAAGALGSGMSNIPLSAVQEGAGDLAGTLATTGTNGAVPAALSSEGAGELGSGTYGMKLPSNPGSFSGSTFANNLTNPDAWKEAFGGPNTANNLRAASMGIGALGQAFAPGMPQPIPVVPSADSYKRHKRDRTFTQPTDPLYALHGSEPQMFEDKPLESYAGGGMASMDNPIDGPTMKKIRAIRSRYRSRDAAVADIKMPGSFMQQLGVLDPTDPVLDLAYGYTKKQGPGKADAGTYLAGGGLAGDGLSDSIPATINGAKPARLAANEYVVPADVVSHLGNGSSDAGAQQLQGMIARVRAARTGTPQQAPAIDAQRMLPA